MIKRPQLVRERVLARVLDMLEHLRIQLSMLPETEVDILKQIERPQQFDFAVDVANHVMAKLGHQSKQAETGSRFDATRRTLAKKQGKRRGRGVLTPEDQALLEGKTGEPSGSEA